MLNLSGNFLQQFKFNDLRRNVTVLIGKVKWFNQQKGFGFIETSEGDKDVFVHVTAVKEAGLESLEEGQSIEYEMIAGPDGREMAGNLSVG